MNDTGPTFAPCPFCGGNDIDPHYMTDGDLAPLRGDGAMPGCRSCGATAPSREAWNQRTYQTVTGAQRARYIEDAGKVDELQAQLTNEHGRADKAERLLWEVDAVARYLGNDYGVPDCIDNHGAVYQSDQLHQLLDQVDARERQVAAPPPEGEPSDTHRWAARDASGASMCADCGVDLDDDESVKPCNAPHTPEQTKCPNCGGRGHTDASGTGCICKPEQAHGDALAALTTIRKEFVDTVADRRVREYGQKLVHEARQALTASGVPYVPESIQRLPDVWLRRSREWKDTRRIVERRQMEADAAELRHEIERSLASAPAVPDGWVLVPRKPTKDMCHAGCEVSVSPDVPAEIWNAMIAAAPSDGGG